MKIHRPDDKVVPLRLAPDEASLALAQAREIERTITQDGVARVFAARYLDRLRFDHTAGAWFEWTGTHWRRDATQRAFQFVREIAREFTEGGDDGALRSIRRTSFASGVERFAQCDPSLATTADQWDRDPFLLGTPAGTVDLRTGTIRAAAPSEGITKITAVAPADTADCPTWERFLDETTGGDRAIARFLQAWAGYGLTGDTREHALVFGYGPGGNGKSVFLNTITRIMADYAVTAAAETFTASMMDRHSTELAMLRGARLVAASETEQGRQWAESRVKALTGGDPITARFMRQDNFTFTPQFKLTIIGNHQPTLQHVDEAVRRRFNIVPFLHKPAQVDLQLEDKLRDEWPEILRWMIKGCIDWQRNGLTRPAAVIEATDTYFADQDLLGQWLNEFCDLQPGNDRIKETSTALYRCWCAFVTKAGQEAESQKAFVAALQRRGIEHYKDKRGRGFKGIGLRLTAMGDG